MKRDTGEDATFSLNLWGFTKSHTNIIICNTIYGYIFIQRQGKHTENQLLRSQPSSKTNIKSVHKVLMINSIAHFFFLLTTVSVSVAVHCLCLCCFPIIILPMPKFSLFFFFFCVPHFRGNLWDLWIKSKKNFFFFKYDMKYEPPSSNTQIILRSHCIDFIPWECSFYYLSTYMVYVGYK